MNENTSVELVKANFSLELSKIRYQDALQNISDLEITRDNIPDAQEKLKQARKILTKFDEIKTAGKAEALAICKNWDAAYRDLKTPFEQVLAEKGQKVSKIDAEIEAERMAIERENNRVQAIKQSIDTFFLDQSKAIANAKTVEELTNIQRLVGSNKANKSRYAEFLPTLAEKAQILDEIIKAKKDALKQMDALNRLKTGSDEEVLAVMEQKEQIDQKLSEIGEKAQTTAINMAINEPENAVEVMQEAPKPSRSWWTWEVKDAKETLKRMPSWINLEPNKAIIDDYLKAKKAEGIEVEEFTFAGIRFFLNKKW